MTARDLRRVKSCAAKLEAAQRSLYDAIMAASSSGESLRDIAAAAGMSAQGIHKIIGRERKRRQGEPAG